MSRPHPRLIPEIQGLRAIAVAAVLIYHIWPNVLPGGYVGVDVFFVISGFLITGSLFKEIEATGRVNVAGFYARRIRRLLPAATLVSVTVALFIPIFPRYQWGDIATSVAASALYVQNWFLAAQAVDYLADDAKAPMTHFWSLSVEEQYYIVWPLLLLLILFLTRSSKVPPRAALGWMIGLIGAGSLTCSIVWTSLDPGAAYFATATRAWELALGGALALANARQTLPGWLRTVLAPLGIAAIAVACLAFSERTQFPGYAALLPTLGSVAVILSSGQQPPWSAQRALSSASFQYLGGISYSLYLWHWPIIVVYEVISERRIGIPDGAALLLMSLALAHLSKVFVEDYFLMSRFSIRQTVAVGAGCVAISLAAAAGFLAADFGEGAKPGGKLPPGALALADPHYNWRNEKISNVVPKPERARDDVPDAYDTNCRQDLRGTDVKTCDFGSPESKFKIVMLGDSHATHWFPTFEEIARRQPIYFRGATKAACLFSTEIIYSGALKRPYTECAEWSRNVIAWLEREKPDLVLVSQSPAYPVAVVGGVASAWTRLIEMGLKVQAIRSTPWMPFEAGKCLASKKDWLNDCVARRSSVLKRDPIFKAAAKSEVDTIDFSNSFCDTDSCPVIIGGVLLYRDSHHITATYARTLSQVMEQRLSLGQER